MVCKTMKKSDFYFDLPEELIAQTPLEKRDSSRLLTMNRQTGALEHKHFFDIVDYLQSGDCLVMNDSRVLPARLLTDVLVKVTNVLCVEIYQLHIAMR